MRNVCHSSEPSLSLPAAAALQTSKLPDHDISGCCLKKQMQFVDIQKQQLCLSDEDDGPEN